MKPIGPRLLAIWVGVGFGANYAWEMLHMPLFAGMQGGWLRCASAAVGDVAVLGLLYAIMSAAAASWLWFTKAILPRTIALAAIGSLVATVIELRALADGRWTYADRMPLVPFLGVGWSPVLQMVLIPLALTWLSRRASRGR